MKYYQEIKSILIDYSTENVEDVIEEKIKEDFNDTITGIFSAINYLIPSFCRRQERLFDIIFKLEEIVDAEENTKHLKIIKNNIKTLLSSIQLKECKNSKKDLEYIIRRLKTLDKSIAVKITNSTYQNDLKVINHLIFSEKDIEKVKRTINQNPSVLSMKDEKNNTVLYNILKKYVELEEYETQEIDYLYKVISLFIHTKHFHQTQSDRLYYLSILNNPLYRNKSHIASILNMFQNEYTVPLSELEKRYRVSLIYPKNIEWEMNEFRMNNTGRYDLTRKNIITIDDAEDRCLDDALYMEKNQDGTYTLFINITDIPAFIPYNSKINKEAMKREETLYLIDCQVPLYPEIISNYICSLLPNNNRNTITSVILTDPDFNVIDFKLIKAKIRSKHKLSYEQVDNLLENPCDKELDIMLNLLAQFALKQKKLNPKKELYRKRENEINPQSHHQSMKTDYSISANIVQESMILENRLIPKYFDSKSLPYANRVLAEQTPEYLNEQLNLLLLKSGIYLDKQEKAKILKKLKYTFLSAKYSVDEHGHSGLGQDFYSHSSSPARRYPDGIGQYVIYDLIFSRPTDAKVKFWYNELSKWCAYFNERKIINSAFSSQYNYLVANKKLIKTR